MIRQSEPAVREGAGREGPSELWVAGASARELLWACGLVKNGSAACHGSAGRGRPKPLLQSAERRGSFYVRCWARCLFISNMVTRFLPNTAWSFSSAMISRLLAGSWRLTFLPDELLPARASLPDVPSAGLALLPEVLFVAGTLAFLAGAFLAVSAFLGSVGCLALLGIVGVLSPVRVLA